MQQADTDLETRVSSLEQTVVQLRNRIEELEGDDGGSTGGPYDRYDEYVLSRVEDVAEAHPRTLIRLYDESGIVDDGKKKTRTKRLKRLAGE